MSFPPIASRPNLAPLDLLRDHLLPGRPVVVPGGIADWPALSRWTPASFRDRFGHLGVTLQGDDFSVVGRTTLRDYIDALPEHERRGGAVPYLRWTEGERDNFTEIAFAALKDDWSRPRFLPEHGYLQPLEWRSEPTRRRYPASGIYLSPRGAVTRMHADRGRSNAVLCQIHGQKRCFFVPPHQRRLLGPLDRRRPIPLDSPAHAGSYAPATVFEATLDPGDVLFIPARWLHEVYTTRTSISLTYNFVHLLEAPRWLPYAIFDTAITQPLEVLQEKLRRLRGARGAAVS